MITIAIGVPASDRSDLNPLHDVAPDAELVETRPLDGEAVVQLVLVLTTASFPFVRDWLVARAQARQHFRVTIEGIEMTGYTAREAEGIVAELAKRLDAAE